ncbi:hypothetical protein MHYP_G00190470 [Metynnis hypsauchen]
MVCSLELHSDPHTAHRGTGQEERSTRARERARDAPNVTPGQIGCCTRAQQLHRDFPQRAAAFKARGVVRDRNSLRTGSSPEIASLLPHSRGTAAGEALDAARAGPRLFFLLFCVEIPSAETGMVHIEVE